MSRADLAALDAYLAALGSMQNAAGRAVRAMEYAEAAGLPPLEQLLTGDVSRSADLEQPDEGGERAADWIARHAHLAGQPAAARAPHSDAPNRLAQAIANLMDAGLWPWV